MLSVGCTGILVRFQCGEVDLDANADDDENYENKADANADDEADADDDHKVDDNNDDNHYDADKPLACAPIFPF